MLRRLLIAGAPFIAVVVLLGVGTYYLMNSRTYQLAGRIVHHVDTDDKMVALTIDDGPSAQYPEVLKVLADAQIPATFYLIGENLAAWPEAGRAIAQAGHELGNHSYTHQRMVFVSADTVRDELERTDAEIRETGYQGPITFRPPFGKKLWALPKYLSDHDRTTVTWDVEPDSGKVASTDGIVAETVAQVRPGSIVLLHVWSDQGAASLAAIPRIVSELRSRGYSFVTVSNLIGH
ncbi:polysaccharide deacetylase family protein [Nocardia sp. NPDC004604]|uniref:polysaccharide deacetylase family protein n=1 Tax=Nocardia sp. NPDC004604 TaxID=3157013 RepID=UPI0033B90FCE